jgi:hypothetical protein
MTNSRVEILSALAEHKARMAERFGVARLALFGSAARNDLGASSDVDVLVEFAGPATFRQYMDLKFYLEELLGRQVDLVTEKALRKELRPYIDRELVRVA